LKEIQIKSDYLYLPEYNIILNNQIKNLFKKYSASRKIQINRPYITAEVLKKNLIELPQVIFEITQQCNLRCKYCIYSGKYYHQREHSKSFISLKTVKTGLDYIYNIIKNREKKEFSIGFYGGEPLIQFQLIKNIIKYSKLLFKNWKLYFSMTTNLTLANKKIVRFLISEDFKILVSLDGPKDNHDSKRVFRNGLGSFSKVMHNLHLIKNEDINFFEKNVSFSAVYSEDLSIMNFFKFFNENNLINKNRVRFSPVDTMNTNYYKKYKPDKNRLQKNIIEIEEKIKKQITNKKILNPIETYFFERLMNNNKINFRDFSLFLGACIFNSRLFIDVDGRFHLCEKLNNSLFFGDVWEGHDFDKMIKIVDDFFSITDSNCSKCDYSFLCLPCYVFFADKGFFKLNTDACKVKKKGLLRCLKNIVDLGELDVSKETKNNNEYTYKFHQFIVLKKGPAKTAIIDFLKGNVYQVENKTIEKFNNSYYDKDVDLFFQSAMNEELIIKTKKGTWIPNSLINGFYLELEKIVKKRNIILELEEGVDLNLVKEEFRNTNVYEINMYSENQIDEILPSVNITYKTMDFNQCKKLSCVDEDFDCDNINEYYYMTNKIKHPCWRNKLAVSKKGEFKPCIYSEIVLGKLGQTNLNEICKKVNKYWYLTKDKITKCKDCELRYICFDCREIAYRKNGNLYAENPNCKYNPYTGNWS
jgi:uncharacterized protein